MSLSGAPARASGTTPGGPCGSTVRWKWPLWPPAIPTRKPPGSSGLGPTLHRAGATYMSIVLSFRKSLCSGFSTSTTPHG